MKSERPAVQPSSSERARQRRAEKLELALIAEVISRRLTIPGTDAPLIPYPEQIAGARAMLRGAVAEMATGEGKTITAALVAARWAREGPGHIATANAYLASRDAALLEPVYADLGLTTGVVTSETPPAARREQYQRDIVYSTLSEFGFDYLRDRLVTRIDDRVQVRGLGALIVDEADLLLIDEARTPLVIARPAPDEATADPVPLARLVEQLVAEQAVRVAAKLERLRTLLPRTFEAEVLAAQLHRGAPRDPAVLAYFEHNPTALRRTEQTERELRGASAWMLDDGLLYSVDERSRTAYFTEDGQAVLESRLGPIFIGPQASGETLAVLRNLVLAYALFQRDRDYLVRDGRVVLIEEATGRAAESRRYMHGLHAAIEVKELGAPEDETETLAQISVQQFVRLYERRAGMTGTARAAAGEFARIYGMDVARIPRHRPNRRVDLPANVYRTAAEVDRAVVAAIAAAHTIGRPVLAGTRDVARSEQLSRLLTAAGLPHAILNAREHAREAEIVVAAGRLGAITVATNMAGRGTDIRLQPGLEDEIVARAVCEIQRGAIDAHVMVDCASPHAFQRLRAALAEARVDLTTLHEDHRLVVRAGPHPPTSSPTPSAGSALRGDQGADLQGGTPHACPGVPGTSKAEGEAGLASLAATVHEPVSPFPLGKGAGGLGLPKQFPFGLGLFVIAVEPQPSRRLDDQLRGRSGRQGDEGVTHLYASLDDETVRFYVAAAVRARAARALRARPSLEGRSARRVFEDAQRRAERVHQGQRRVLFEFDQVIEAQRRAMLAAYERVLLHPAPDEAVRSFIAEVATGELARGPADPAAWPAWLDELRERYGLPEEAMSSFNATTRRRRNDEEVEADRVTSDSFLPRPPPPSPRFCVSALEERLAERYEKARREAGRWWPALARAALLRSAAELWARHVETIDHLQRQAPAIFGFLPTPAVVTFAREASRAYADYVWAVRAEALAALLTLPQPYERPLPARVVPVLSPAAAALVRIIPDSRPGSEGA